MGDPVKPPPGVVSKTGYAAHRGCSPAYISKLVRLGKIAAPALMADGRINIILADQMLGAAHQSEGLPLNAPTANDRQRREKADADLRELELAERQGRLLDAGKVAAERFEVARRARDTLFAMAEARAAELCACTTPRLLADLLRQRIGDALADLADSLEQAPSDELP